MNFIKSTVTPDFYWCFDQSLPETFDFEGHTFRLIGTAVHMGAPCEVWQSRSFLPKTIHNYKTKSCEKRCGDCSCTRRGQFGPVGEDDLPMCEECDIQMHPYSYDGEEGYSCDGCGWSFEAPLTAPTVQRTPIDLGDWVK